MKKVDIHAHILPETWEDLKQKFGYGGFIQIKHTEKGKAEMIRDDGRFFRAIEENCWNPDAILEDMDRDGVRIKVLCTVPVLFNYWAKPEHTFEWCRFLNDHLCQVIEAYPQRFIGLGTLPMQNIDLAIKEMERCNALLGMPGVEIGSNINNKNLDDPDFYPFWEAAQDLNVAILVHPWEMMGEKSIPKYFLPWLVGMPAETSRAICSMIFGGIFDKFPKLKVMFTHGGGAFPFTLGRIDHGFNARPDLCAVNIKNAPSTYLDKFYIDSITHDEEALRYLIDLFGSKKIAFGTDYPFPLGDLEHGKMIENMDDLSTSIKEDLFVNTAFEFLGVKKSNYF